MKNGLKVACAAAIAAVLFNVSANASTVVYNNDFSSGAGSEWSNASTRTDNGEKYLADPATTYGFGAITDTLSLTGLAAHTSVTISFDLYMIGSQDGNGPAGGGPDPWSLGYTGNSTNNLISTNFANFSGGGNTQSFGGPNGLGGYLTGGTYAARTGETAANHLGFGTGDFGDATYHLSFTFNDAASALSFAFTSGENEGPGNEGWGLDNVTVSTNADVTTAPAAPLPSAALTGGGLMLVLCGATAFRRRTLA